MSEAAFSKQRVTPLVCAGMGEGRVGSCPGPGDSRRLAGAEAPSPHASRPLAQPRVSGALNKSWSLQGGNPNQDAGGTMGLQLQRADPRPQGPTELPVLSQERIQWWVSEFFK